MTSEELIKILKDYPDCIIDISIDVSTCEENSTDRVFSREYYDFQVVEREKRITLMFDGYTNF